MSSELLIRVNDWHNRANKEKEDYFVKFIFDYLAFVALICHRNYGNKSDRQLIQELKRNNEHIRENYYSKANHHRINEIVEILKSDPITNDTNPNDKWWDCVLDNCPNQVSPNDGIIESVDDFQNILEYIYRARNNLFHGRKGMNLRRDSLIVEYGFYLLNPLVEVLIDSKGN
jgi:hypothetical protein